MHVRVCIFVTKKCMFCSNGRLLHQKGNHSDPFDLCENAALKRRIAKSICLMQTKVPPCKLFRNCFNFLKILNRKNKVCFIVLSCTEGERTQHNTTHAWNAWYDFASPSYLDSVQCDLPVAVLWAGDDFDAFSLLEWGLQPLGVGEGELEEDGEEEKFSKAHFCACSTS